MLKRDKVPLLIYFALILFSVILLSGCIHGRGGSKDFQQPCNKPVAKIKYVHELPKALKAEEYRAIERIVGRIPALKDPIVVQNVFVEWLGHPVTVLYRTDKYDVILVKDSNGKWRFSKVMRAPDVD